MSIGNHNKDYSHRCCQGDASPSSLIVEELSRCQAPECLSSWTVDRIPTGTVKQAVSQMRAGLCLFWSHCDISLCSFSQYLRDTSCMSVTLGEAIEADSMETKSWRELSPKASTGCLGFSPEHEEGCWLILAEMRNTIVF